MPQHNNNNVEEPKKRDIPIPIMGRRNRRVLKDQSKSYTLPSSPTHSSSSSDFEFTISISPRKSSTTLCPADELFYKGQLLPLHLSPRISMVRTLLLSSSSTSSSSTAPRDSTGSSASNSSFNTDLPECDSSRPSSVTDDDDLKRLHNPIITSSNNKSSSLKKTHKYFSLSRFSSVFRKETVTKTVTKTVTGEETVASHVSVSAGNSSVKRMSVTAKEVIRKYLKKVKPLYEKLSQKQQQQQQQQTVEGTNSSITTTMSVLSILTAKTERSVKEVVSSTKKENVGMLSHSFSGNLRYPRKRSCVSSCPSSMRSSPSHSGVLSQKGVLMNSGNGNSSSSMEELHSAIQGAIAHCKNSLIQNKPMVSNNEINLI